MFNPKIFLNLFIITKFIVCDTQFEFKYLTMTKFTTFDISENIEDFSDDVKTFINTGRLPEYIKPDIYEIFYKFDRELSSYIGIVKIKIKFQKNSNFIILHSSRNILDSVSIQKVENGSLIDIDISKILLYSNTDFIVIYLKNIVNINEVFKLSIEFHADVFSGLDGLYISNYLNKDGENKFASF